MHPKHYSQIEKAIQCFDKSSTNEFLTDNRALLLLFKKAERFVAALYILTELFPDAEPLKWELRFLGTSLSKNILSSKGSSAISKENIGDTFGTVICIASLLEIAHITNFISAMNLSIFRKELDVLASLLESRGRGGGKTIGGGTPFPENFFHVAQETVARELKEIIAPRPSGDSDSPRNQSGRSAPRDSLSDSVSKQSTRRIKDIVSKGQLLVGGSVLYDKSYEGHKSAKHRKEARKRAIFEVLNLQPVAMIKDFSAVIKDCSEKTVQRELLGLVGAGLLKKDGERRWSRYSLFVRS